MRLAIALMVCFSACTTHLPARYVIERDLDDYHFRRYQQSLETDVPIAGNKARGHAAAYMRHDARGAEVLTALVSVYERAARLTEALRAELSTLPGYELQTQTLAGQYVWRLRSSTEPTFWLWPSGQYVVKLGAPPGQNLPEAIARPYANLYPSDLDSHGHALPGAASGGSDPDITEDEDDAPLSPGAAPTRARHRAADARTLAESRRAR